jgi:hypothetical protein
MFLRALVAFPACPGMVATHTCFVIVAFHLRVLWLL